MRKTNYDDFKTVGPRERDLYFDERSWVAHPIQKIHSLSLNRGSVKFGPRLQFTLYMLRGQKYVYHSEGSEVVTGNNVLYYSLFPFAGKVRVRG